jgi:hypothetical protein
MATCDRGHEPITFESPFSSECPLCAALLHAKAAAGIAKYEAEDAIETAECQAADAERRAEKAEEEMTRLKNRYEGN